MPAKHSRHVALNGPLVEWVDSQIAEGEYASVSDLIRTAVRLLGQRGWASWASADRVLASTADNHV